MGVAHHWYAGACDVGLAMVQKSANGIGVVRILGGQQTKAGRAQIALQRNEGQTLAIWREIVKRSQIGNGISKSIAHKTAHHGNILRSLGDLRGEPD